MRKPTPKGAPRAARTTAKPESKAAPRGGKPARPTRGPGNPSGAAARPGRGPAKPAQGPATPARSPRKPGRPSGNLERLQKILAHAGVDSRRKCEELILAGRVHVNGQLVTELGAKADPVRDEVTLDYRPVEKERPVYILMNKPKGYVTTVKDNEGRPTVMALLQGIEARVYPVGRLDFNSEGLLLLTNDGELAQHLSAPEFHIPKIYLVKIHRIPPRETLDDLREGFRLDGRRLNPCQIEMVEKTDNPWVRVTLIEGKNRQIRRMFEAVGHPVHKLRRIQYGPLADPALKPGAWRLLTTQEITALKSL
jgi:23S rRNA pseudouridine2605 synthase